MAKQESTHVSIFRTITDKLEQVRSIIKHRQNVMEMASPVGLRAF